MLRRLIIFLIRWRLGLKEKEFFRFNNQKSKTDIYCFTKHSLMKTEFTKSTGKFDITGIDIHESNVSLNWLLDARCKIHKVPTEEVAALWRSV
jgi:hypothetical protein